MNKVEVIMVAIGIMREIIEKIEENTTVVTDIDQGTMIIMVELETTITLTGIVGLVEEIERDTGIEIKIEGQTITRMIIAMDDTNEKQLTFYV